MANLIEHVVVVMLENRSYDNVLGWLYNSSNAAPYDQAPSGQSDLNGLTGAESNPNPYGGTQTVLNQPTQTIGVSGQVYPGTAIPMIDPGETFGDMAQQFSSGTMQGFMDNYKSKGKDMTSANVQDVMNYLTPAQLPVTAFLANQFAVCDAWFAPVPTQTFTNRVFAFCAAPAIVDLLSVYSVVDDEQYMFTIDPVTLRAISTTIELPSICSQLDAVLGLSNVNWKVYFHDYSIAAMTVPYVAGFAGSGSNNERVAPFDGSDWGSTMPAQLNAVPSTFADDVANGTLPPYSFIEPRYSRSFATNPLPANSNHPGPGNYSLMPWLLTSDPSDPPIDATGGELLLMQVYNLLRQSDSWKSTLLIITYDEPGGVYDHVAPPPATPPGTVHLEKPSPLPNIPDVSSISDPPANGFGYTMYGGRVPAIVVSPYIQQGTTIRSATGTPFDHTSIVKTVWEAFNLSQPPSTITSLTQRDANAPSLTSFLDANANNDAPLFGGTIVASPSTLIFIGGVTSQTLLFSAGPGFGLGATVDGDDWLQLSDPTLQTNVIAVTVSVDTNNLTPGVTYTNSITISGPFVNSVTVPVTLYAS
jgi:phospholipase C